MAKRQADLSKVSLNTILGELSRRFSKDEHSARRESLMQCAKVELPEWFDKGRWHQLQGDASKASSEWFQVYWEGPDNIGEIRICIWCPQFLRGSLSLTVHKDGFVSGSY